MKAWLISVFLLAGCLHAETVSTAKLKSWYAGEKPMVVIDARPKPYFDNHLLPDALWLPYDTAKETLEETLPLKDITLVVYCGGPKCPASGMLAARLEKLGYTNVYEYPEGIKGWIKQGNPIKDL